MIKKPGLRKSGLLKPSVITKAEDKTADQPVGQSADKPAPEHTSKYPKQVAIAAAVTHVVLAIIISAWYLHPYIIKPSGFGYIIYILEIPGALVASVTGLAKDAESSTPYYVAFFVTTVIYGGLGYLVGYFLQTYGWDKEVNRLCNLETEVYNEPPAV